MYRLVNSSTFIYPSFSTKSNKCIRNIYRSSIYPLSVNYSFSSSSFFSRSISASSSSSSTYFRPMNHWTVLKAVAPIVKDQLKDVSLIDIFASLVALQKYQNRHNHGKQSIEYYLPGTSAMPNNRLDSALLYNAFRMCKYATATYGWMGHLFFWLTDPDASRGFTTLSQVARSTLTGDTDAFLTIASITREQLLYSSSSVQIGIPKHFIVIDHTLKAVILTIRGTMSLNDALTDALAREIPFCNGYAHEGIAFAAKTIYESTRDILEKELRNRPGYTLMVTGHSLGAATAMLYTILVNYERQCRKDIAGSNSDRAAYPFPRVDIECHAFAAPPVFSPLSVLPSSVSSSIISWIHREDLIPRLTLQGLKDLVRLCKKVSSYHPSLTGRLLHNDIELQSILESEPDWLQSWNRDPSKRKITNGVSENTATILTARGSTTIVEDQHLSGSIDQAQIKKENEELQHELDEVRSIVTELQSQLSLSSSETEPGRVPSPSSISTISKTEIPRFQIPGTIFCFRAPIEDIGANKGMVNEVSTTTSSSPFFRFDPAALNPFSVLPSPTAMVSSVSSWMNSTTEFVGSTVNSISVNINNIINPKSVPESDHSFLSGKYTNNNDDNDNKNNNDYNKAKDNTNDPVTNADRLIPEVTKEATKRAAIDTIPYVTVCSADDLRNLPITDTAWRDHVPDQYLFVLRQLMEIALNQRKEQEKGNPMEKNETDVSSDTTADAHRTVDTRHVHIGNGQLIRISKEAEQKGESKDRKVTEPRQSVSRRSTVETIDITDEPVPKKEE